MTDNKQMGHYLQTNRNFEYTTLFGATIILMI